VTPAERLFWHRVQQRAARLQPDLSREIIRGFRELRSLIGETGLLNVLEAGAVDRIIQEALNPTTLKTAFQPLRERIVDGVRQAAKAHGREMPAQLRTASVGFDILNPKIVSAIGELDTRVMQTLGDSVRETVRQIVTRGIEEGQGPRAIARDLRDRLALAPNQEAAVANFQRMLEEGDTEALTRALRDRRFDGSVKKAFAGDGLSESQIGRMVESYRRRMEAFNAETIARTAALDAQRLGQHLTWQAAGDRGDVNIALVQKTWRGVLDSRERPSHVAMEGQVVGFDDTFSNGQTLPGDDEYNCRCIPMYSLKDPSESTP
jgi:uncharacterized protein with gpF-like domain